LEGGGFRFEGRQNPLIAQRTEIHNGKEEKICYASAQCGPISHTGRRLRLGDLIYDIPTTGEKRMTFWNGKEKPIMAAASTKPDPERKSAGRQAPSKTEPEQPNPLPLDKEDPIDSSMHLWVLRLWVVCALVIIGYAVCNYFANWWAK
jgi:hypothetical protein